MSEYGLDKTAHPFERIDDLGDEDGQGYLLAFTYESKDDRITWVNWFMIVIYGRSDNKQPILAKAETTSLPPTDGNSTYDWREAEFIASGRVKWDACSQWEASSLHFDSASDRHEFFGAVDKAHIICREIIGDAWDMSAGEP